MSKPLREIDMITTHCSNCNFIYLLSDKTKQAIHDLIASEAETIPFGSPKCDHCKVVSVSTLDQVFNIKEKS